MNPTSATPSSSFYVTRRQTYGVGTVAVVAACGLLITGASCYIILTSRIASHWKRTQGEISGTRDIIAANDMTMYVPVVSYTVDGTSYRTYGSDGRTNKPVIGSRSEVAYDPASPAQAKLVADSKPSFLTIFAALVGVGTIVLAPLLRFRSRRRTTDIHRLVLSGHKVQGTITDIRSSGNEGKPVYSLIVTAKDSAGHDTTYTSDSLSSIGDLANAGYRTRPIVVGIYIDPANPKKYYVDTEHIAI